ncbi:MAG: hypothetical protein K2H85_08450 [Allobaculum sp.]|nr:hypothetical protein [Allobaculum sp.]
MGTQAAWKDKVFEVSEIYTAPLENFKTGWEQEADITESTDDQKKQVVTRGVKPFEISCSTTLVYPCAGNVRTGYTSWSPYIGQVDYFYMADQASITDAFGPPVQLIKCELAELITDGHGRWLKAKVNLKFREYDAEKAAIKADLTSVNSITPGVNTRKEVKRILDLKEQNSYYGERVTFQVGSTVRIDANRWADGIEVPPSLQGTNAQIEQIDNSGIRMLVAFPNGDKTWVNTSGVSLCE